MERGWRKLEEYKPSEQILDFHPKLKFFPSHTKCFFRMFVWSRDLSTTKIWVVEKGWIFCYLRLLATCIVMCTSNLRGRDRGIWHRDCALQTELSVQIGSFEYLLPNSGRVCWRSYGQSSQFCISMYCNRFSFSFFTFLSILIKRGMSELL